MPNVKLLIPNVEMRLDLATERRRPINLHLLFSPEDDDHEDHSGAHEAQGTASATDGHHVGGSAAENRANRRRRRKGKHHDGDGADAPGTPVDSAGTPAAEITPINLKAHADDPDAASDLGEALVDTGRPRKRRRAASRPAGSPQSAAEAS